MNPAPKKTKQAANAERRIAVVSGVFDDGTILEMLSQPKEKRSAYAVWKEGKYMIEPSFRLAPTIRAFPYSPQNNLIKNDVVLLPSEPEEYGSEGELFADIRSRGVDGLYLSARRE